MSNNVKIRSFISCVAFFIALLMIFSMVGCKFSDDVMDDIAEAYVSHASASASSEASPEQTDSPSPTAEQSDAVETTSEAFVLTETSDLPQPDLTIAGSGTLLLDANTNTIVQSDTFYSYKDTATGFVDIEINAGGEATSDITLDLTQHEYYSADGMEGLLYYQPDPPEDPTAIDPANLGVLSSAPLEFTINDDNTDSINITEPINAAIAAGASSVRIYFALADTTTEHSVEWYGTDSENPPNWRYTDV